MKNFNDEAIKSFAGSAFQYDLSFSMKNEYLAYMYYQGIKGIKKREHGTHISFPNGASAGTIKFPFPPKERRALGFNL